MIGRSQPTRTINEKRVFLQGESDSVGKRRDLPSLPVFLLGLGDGRWPSPPPLSWFSSPRGMGPAPLLPPVFGRSARRRAGQPSVPTPRGKISPKYRTEMKPPEQSSPKIFRQRQLVSCAREPITLPIASLPLAASTRRPRLARPRRTCSRERDDDP